MVDEKKNSVQEPYYASTYVYIVNPLSANIFYYTSMYFIWSLAWLMNGLLLFLFGSWFEKGKAIKTQTKTKTKKKRGKKKSHLVTYMYMNKPVYSRISLTFLQIYTIARVHIKYVPVFSFLAAAAAASFF